MRSFVPQYDRWISINVDSPVWSHVFTVAPLVVIGTKEGNHYDLAPKHMVTPLGLRNYFGFVCTPAHETYHNVKREKAFVVSFVRPDQVVLASFAASPRCGTNSSEKSIVGVLPTMRATAVDALFLSDSYFLMECVLERIVDGFGEYSLIAGKVIAAHVHEDYYRFSERDDAQMIQEHPLLAYLADGRFAEIRNTNTFPFPKDFESLLRKNTQED
jgi:flavin reductase (DIM6/NTAB) family NADH-FMN oxidoreductase RutF